MEEKAVRTHNKSHETNLSLLKYTDEQLSDSYQRMKAKLVPSANVLGLEQQSPCALLPNKQGRWTDTILKPGKAGSGTNQLCYGYQLAAFVEFGRERLLQVPANKTANCLTISHLCVEEYCCTLGHARLEPKYINDERTHCQYCIKNILSHGGGYEAVVKFWNLGACPHEPLCGWLV